MKLTERSLVLYHASPAVVTGFEGDKILIDTPSGQKKVREKDVEALHPGPVSSLKAVLAATAPEANFGEAAEFFAGESPSYAELAELLFGTVAGDRAWAAWRAVAESPYFDAASPSLPIQVRSAEEVAERVRKAEGKKAEEAERASFAARLRATWLAANRSAAKSSTGFPISAEDGVRLPEDAKFLQDVEALALGGTEKSRALKEAGIPETRENAHRALLASGFWPLARNPWPAHHGLSLTSSSAPVNDPADEGDRLDLTHLQAWAIDNAWSSDPDDAISIDGDRVWVHVADPASSVIPDSPADLDARARGATLYVPEGAARMLADESLALFALGLSPVSRALSFGIRLGESGSIAEVEIARSLVRVTRLTYAEATARRDESALAPLFAIAERNVERRRAAGAVFIDLPETHLAANPQTGEVTIDPVPDESAAAMVREFMLLAGEAAARFAFKNGIPFPYVSQEEPEIPRDIPNGLAGEYRKRRSMRARKVGTIPADHAGLGIGMYSQVTSPLRRYGDLVAHQQLRLFLAGKAPLGTDAVLERIAAGDTSARECTLAERESNLHWALVFLTRNPGWQGEAIVVERSGAQATVLVPALGQETRIALPGDVGLNEIVRVRAGACSIPDLALNLIPVE